MTASVVVKHNFETAHRLPFLDGKCVNLHGHSWWAEVTLFGDVDRDGILVDFATIKRGLRDWIDAALDHGTMLGYDDPLIVPLTRAGCKVFVFDPTVGPCARRVSPNLRPLHWPTVENVAELIRRITLGLIANLDGLSVHVRVEETHVNAATAR